MELTFRQHLTIKHLKDLGIKTPEQIIAFCEEKLKASHRQNTKGGTIKRRKHSKRYYLQIIDYCKKTL